MKGLRAHISYTISKITAFLYSLPAGGGRKKRRRRSWRQEKEWLPQPVHQENKQARKASTPTLRHNFKGYVYFPGTPFVFQIRSEHGKEQSGTSFPETHSNGK